MRIDLLSTRLIVSRNLRMAGNNADSVAVLTTATKSPAFGDRPDVAA